MAKSLLIEGLKDAVRHARGDKSRSSSYTVYVDHPLDVRAIRTKLGLTQTEFARKYGFNIHSLRNWEQGKRSPVGAFQNLLKLIDAMPEDVERVLSSRFAPAPAAA
jgi:putative transcriptional regulator